MQFADLWTFGGSFSDAYAGKKAKLVDAQLRNKNGTWLKYSTADYNFTDLGDDNLTWPASPDQDWSKFSVVNKNGNKTWPVPTVAFAASNIDIRDKGRTSYNPASQRVCRKARLDISKATSSKHKFSAALSLGILMLKLPFPFFACQMGLGFRI